jgi:putative hydrolase of the HAD superfamily
MNNPIKVIVFDLGNVLVDVDYTNALERISGFSRKKPREIVSTLVGSDITGRFEEGNISPEDFFLEIKSLLGLEISYEAFVPIWNEVFFLSSTNRAVYSLANQLRLRYEVVLLSNVNKLHYEYLKKNFPVFNVFSRVFASCEMGLIKPDRRIYLKILESLGVAAQDVFYTDDRAELIESARELGINSFIFKGITKLTEDLTKAGVLQA